MDYSALTERLRQIDAHIETLESRLANAPEGRFELSTERGHQRYYRTDPSTHRKHYLGRNDIELISHLAQRDYDRRALRILQQERKDLNQLIVHNAPQQLRAAYRQLSTARKALITPLTIPDEEYVARWESVEYERMPIDGQGYLTEKGDLVRSKSEVIIANALYNAHIPYRYEFPVRLARLGIVHPDFTVLNVRTRKEFYWEHLGMMGNPEYSNNAISKLAAYESSGYILGKNLIITMESQECALDTRLIKNRIETFFV